MRVRSDQSKTVKLDILDNDTVVVLSAILRELKIHGIKGLSENKKLVPDPQCHIRTKRAFYGANECSKLIGLFATRMLSKNTFIPGFNRGSGP